MHFSCIAKNSLWGIIFSQKYCFTFIKFNFFFWNQILAILSTTFTSKTRWRLSWVTWSITSQAFSKALGSYNQVFLHRAPTILLDLLHPERKNTVKLTLLLKLPARIFTHRRTEVLCGEASFPRKNVHQALNNRGWPLHLAHHWNCMRSFCSTYHLLIILLFTLNLIQIEPNVKKLPY